MNISQCKTVLFIAERVILYAFMLLLAIAVMRNRNATTELGDRLTQAANADFEANDSLKRYTQHNVSNLVAVTRQIDYRSYQQSAKLGIQLLDVQKRVRAVEERLNQDLEEKMKNSLEQ